MAEKELDLSNEAVPSAEKTSTVETGPIYDERPDRERARGQLSLGLLGLLTLTVGGVLFFIGFDKVEGTALTESVLPAVVALAGTALGFYFGQSAGTAGRDTTNPTPSAAAGADINVVVEQLRQVLAGVQPPPPAATGTTGTTGATGTTGTTGTTGGTGPTGPQT